MKKTFLLSFALVVVSTLGAFAQFLSSSMSVVGGNNRLIVGQSSTLEAQLAAVGGNYTGFQWTISFPEQYFDANVAPTGSGLTWTKNSSSSWQTTVPSITDGQVLTVTFPVIPNTPSPSTLIQIEAQSSGAFGPTNGVGRVSVYIDPAAANTITVTPPTSSVSTNTPVTLTASGCTGGTYTWSPAGGTASGATYTVTSASAATTTYTATCSTGGSGTASVTWTTSTPTCLANAGTLN